MTPAADRSLPAAFRRAGRLLCACLIAGAAACAGPAESAPVDGTIDDRSPLAPDPLGHLLVSPPVAPDEEEAILDGLRDAVRDVRDGGSVDAVHRADSLLALLPTLGDWRPLLRAELLAMTTDTAGVRGALAEVDPATEFVDRWGWGFHVEVLAAAGDTLRAKGIARITGEQSRSTATSAAAWHRAGELALDFGDTATARDDFHRALRAGPDHGAAQAAARALDELYRNGATHPVDGAPEVPVADREARLRIGRALLASGAWSRVPGYLLHFVEDPGEAGRAGGAGGGGGGAGVPPPLWRPPGAPGRPGRADEEVAELRIGLGRAFVETRRPDDAIRMLAPLTNAEASTDHAAAALFWTGRAALANGDRGGAERAFLTLAHRAPGHALAESGLLLLLEGMPERADRAPVDRLVGELLRSGVRSGPGELLAVRHGADRYLEGNYASAASTFEHYLEGAGRTAARQQASYWAALSHERLGDRERARAHLEATHAEDPLSFYGVFAGERLDVPVLPAGLAGGPDPDPAFDIEIANALTRLRVHQIVPTPGSFNHELARLQAYFLERESAAYDFAESLIDAEFPIQGVVLGREIRAREGEWNVRLLRIVHPFPYRDAVVRESRARGIDPFFVAGLIRQESLFHPSIESPAGAVGLMQLLPSTAQEVARSLGIRYSRDLLTDPEYNIRLGTQFLATMVRRFDGRAEDALSAYNAGPTRITQWRQRDAYRDRDVFMEHIPFQETRHYVKVVQQYTRIYTALYGCPGFEPCLGDSYRVAQARSPFAGSVPGSSLAR